MYYIILVLLLLYLIVTCKEHMELHDKNFPFAFFPSYVNDLDVTGVRLLKSPEEIALRVPNHEVDMRKQFMASDKSNIIFDMTQ